MKYTIIIMHADGNETRKSTDAHNSKQAHEWAQQFATDGATIRAYPTTQDENGNINAYAVLRGALQVAKKSAEKTEGVTDTQQRMINELKSANAKAGKPEAEELGAGYLLDLCARMGADSQDYFGYAYKGILEAIDNGADITEQYHNAYLSINAYVMKQRSATTHELSTEYIEANGGTLVSITTYIARIINNGERYTPTDDNATMDAETAERLGEALSNAMIALTPRQKEIIKLVARDKSQRDIASALNIKNVATVNEHLTHIRAKVLEYFTENAPEFLTIIDGAKVNATNTKRNTDRHTKKNRHNADYYREYRARKKASANA